MNGNLWIMRTRYFLLALYFFLPILATAQMFSVGSSGRGGSSVRTRSVSVVQSEVDFQQDNLLATLQKKGYGISLTDDQMFLAATITKASSNVYSQTLWDLTFFSWQSIPLVQKPNVRLELPLSFGGSYKKHDAREEQRNLESVITNGTPAIGSGLSLTVPLGDKVAFHTHGIYHLGFSFLNDGGRGLAFIGNASAELRFKQLIAGKYGITLGGDWLSQESRLSYTSSWISNLQGEKKQTDKRLNVRVGVNF